MKIALTHDENNVLVVKDYDNAERGLIGQFIAELELIKLDLLDMYVGDDDDE